MTSWWLTPSRLSTSLTNSARPPGRNYPPRAQAQSLANKIVSKLRIWRKKSQGSMRNIQRKTVCPFLTRCSIPATWRFVSTSPPSLRGSPSSWSSSWSSSSSGLTSGNQEIERKQDPPPPQHCDKYISEYLKLIFVFQELKLNIVTDDLTLISSMSSRWNVEMFQV